MAMTHPSVVDPKTDLRPFVLARLKSELESALRSHEERLLLATEPDDIAVAVRRRTEKAREEVLGALSRVVDGTYGQCQTCGTDIAEERLEAMPHTDRCMSCANGHRHRTGR